MQNSTQGIQYKKLDFCLQENRICLPFTTCIRDGVILLNLTTGSGNALDLMKKQLDHEKPVIKEEKIVQNKKPSSLPIPIKTAVKHMEDESILEGEKLAQKILNEFRLKNSEAQAKKSTSTGKQKNNNKRTQKNNNAQTQKNNNAQTQKNNNAWAQKNNNARAQRSKHEQAQESNHEQVQESKHEQIQESKHEQVLESKYEQAQESKHEQVQKNKHEEAQKNDHFKTGSTIKLEEQNTPISGVKKLTLKEKYREINKKHNLKVLKRRSQFNISNSIKSKIQLKYKHNLSKETKSFDSNENNSDLPASEYFISCRFCRKSFKILNDVHNHCCNNSKIVYNEMVFKCELCPSAFKYKNYLDRHMKGHYRNNCKFCNERFTKRKALCKHLKYVHNITEPEKVYKCNFCEKVYAKRLQLHLHLKSHAEGKLLCLKCGFMCSNNEEYAEHGKEHIKDTKFECTLCGKRFVRRQQYDQHMMGHERHFCIKCNVTFSTKKMSLKHQQTIHGISVLKKHQCLVCHKLFVRPIHLEIHLRMHTGEKPVKCYKCEKSFTTERSLTKHLKSARHLQVVNDGKRVELEKPFLCSICGNRFHQQQSLFRHVEMIHTEGEAIKCSQCEYSTKCKANLKRHAEGHFNIKRYVCEVCGATFRALATLKEHQLFVHSESRSFECEICKKSFKNKSGLQRHLRIHSEVRPFKCHCNRDYKRLSHLKRHMVSAHHMTIRKSSDAKKLEVCKIEINKIEEKSKSLSSESMSEARDSTSSNDVNLLNLPKNFLPNQIFETDFNKTTTGDSLVVRASDTGDGNDIYVPCNNLQSFIEKNIAPDIVQKSPLMSIQQSIIPSDSQDSLSLNDPALNLSPNYFNFGLTACPFGASNLDNVTVNLQLHNQNDPPSTLCTPDTATRPRSLPNLASLTPNTDSLFPFSFRNNELSSSFLLGGDLPPSLDQNSCSKQLFGESADILSMPSFASSNEPTVMDCDAEHFFNISRNNEHLFKTADDIWDVSGGNEIVSVPGSCDKVPPSVSSFSSNSDSLLACNLVFPNDPLLDCTIDTSSFNTEDFVLT